MIGRVVRKGVRDEQSENKAHLFWGTVGVAVTLVFVLVAGALYAMPFGERTYTADFASAAGMRPGDEVRIAGIGVGSVRSVELAGDHVDIEFGVRSDVFVGAASTLTVKLLTPIGGHYIMLDPVGDSELGSANIPRERTRVPYELSDVIETATPLVRDIDGDTLRRTVAEVDLALSAQPESTRAIVDDLTSLTDVIAQRSDQLERGLTEGFGNKRDDVVRAFNLLGRLFLLFHRPVMAFEEGLEPSILQLEEITQKLFARLGDFDGAITLMKESSDQLASLLAGGEGPVIDQSQSTVTDLGVCIPVPGGPC